MVARKRVLVGVGIAAMLALLAFLLVGRRTEQRSTPSTQRPSETTARSRSLTDRMRPSTSLAGTVRDPKHAPVAGDRVCAAGRSRDLPSRTFRVPRCATTDSTGAYKIDALIAAAYSVAASAPHRRHAAYQPPELHLAPGEQRTGIDIVLADGGAELRGSVRDITGGPIAGARIAAELRHGPSVAYGETDDSGQFTLWISPGKVFVSADADGYVERTEHAAAGQTVELVLTPASSFSGTVVDARSGTPLAGRAVSDDVDS